jgi:hypothetical protein
MCGKLIYEADESKPAKKADKLKGPLKMIGLI